MQYFSAVGCGVSQITVQIHIGRIETFPAPLIWRTSGT